MRKELEYFRIDDAYGWNQDWFPDYMMRLGGCAAVTACESSIYLALYKGAGELYPFDAGQISRKDYNDFAMMMKPYLRPRWSGVDRLELYTEGFGKYLSDRGCARFGMEAFSGDNSFEQARAAVIRQIDEGFPIPCLTLKHVDRELKDYEWHWFLFTGYETCGEECLVKVVTYGEWRWFDMRNLWNTGYRRKGGLILYRDQEAGGTAPELQEENE